MFENEGMLNEALEEELSFHGWRGGKVGEQNMNTSTEMEWEGLGHLQQAVRKDPCYELLPLVSGLLSERDLRSQRPLGSRAHSRLGPPPPVSSLHRGQLQCPTVVTEIKSQHPSLRM